MEIGGGEEELANSNEENKPKGQARAGCGRPEERTPNAVTAVRSCREAKNPDIPDPCGNSRIGRRLLALAREYQFGHRYKSQPGVAQGGGRNEEAEATNMGNSSKKSGSGRRSECRGNPKARQH